MSIQSRTVFRYIQNTSRSHEVSR